MLSQATKQQAEAEAEVEAEEAKEASGIQLEVPASSVQADTSLSAVITLILVKEHRIGRNLLTTVSSMIRS